MKSSALCFLALATVLSRDSPRCPLRSSRLISPASSTAMLPATTTTLSASPRRPQKRTPASCAGGSSARATPWIAREPGDTARRRLIVATYSLELLHATLDTEWRTFEGLIERHCDAFRKGPSPRPPNGRGFSRPWRWPGASRRQTRAPGSHLTHAEARFPDEPRFKIARAAAFAFDIDGAPGGGVDDAIDRFAKLTALDVRARRSRSPHRPSRLGARKPADALEHARQAIRVAHEPGVAYLAHMLAGRALEKLEDFDGATREYRLAIDAMPGAQSATTTLAALLFSRDQPGEASELVERSLALHARDDDPWRLVRLTASTGATAI